MRSITARLVFSFVLVILVAIGLVALAANQGAQAQFTTYLERGPTVVRLDRAVAVLTSYYGESGHWDGVQALVERLAASQQGRLVLADARGTVLADSSRELNGRDSAGYSLGEKSTISAGGKQVGAVFFSPADYSGGPWWGLLRPPGSQSAGPPASSPTFAPASPAEGMMGPGMMGHMSPADMEQMMGTWHSAGSVVGAPEEAYISGFNEALWVGGLGAGLVALGLALFSARRITRPLRRLALASSRIAGGDLSQRVEVGSRDELGHLASSFNSMAETLARNEETRRRMVTDIAHELRTPLAVLQGNLEGMLDGVVPMDRESVGVLHQETQLLARLVSDLRELSLAEAGQLGLNYVRSDLGEILRGSVAKMSAEAQSREITFDAELPPEFPALDLDPDRISQVTGNLLSNAIRHTPVGGRIAVRLEQIQDDAVPSARVSVADTGPGIAADDLPHIFDRFYRADRSRSRHTGGSGLGLAIVKQLVEAHGGRTWAESVPGHGATFFFTLPLHR